MTDRIPTPPPQSVSPLFCRLLSPTSISKRLPVPEESLADFPDFRGAHAVQLLVRFEGHTYPMVCSIRKTGRYKKPVFSKGWIDFVRQNGLKVGDKVILYKFEHDGTDTMYLIEVERTAVSGSIQKYGPSLPRAAQDSSAITAGGRSPLALRNDGLKRKRELKLPSLVHATKNVKETKPLDPPAHYATSQGDSVDQFRVSSGHSSPDYGGHTIDRDGMMKQLGVGSTSNSPPAVKLFGVSISSGNKDRDETAKQLGFGGPSNSPLAVKLFGSIFLRGINLPEET